MGYFQRIIRQSRKKIWVEGHRSGLPASADVEAIEVDSGRPEADQHRVRPSRKAVDRASDLSFENGEWVPVLELDEEDDSNEGMSSEYVGNSNVSSRRRTGLSDIRVDAHTEVSQFGSVRSGSLERVRSPEKLVMQFSEDLQSDKAHKTKSESEQVELDTGEETGLPRGNRTDPVADIFIEKPVEFAADQLLFRKPSARQTDVDSEEKVEPAPGSIDAALAHPALPIGVAQALKKVQADLARQPEPQMQPQRKAATPTHRPQANRLEKPPTEGVTIGRVSVRVRMPEGEVAARSSAPKFSAEKLTSRYFMGEA